MKKTINPIFVPLILSGTKKHFLSNNPNLIPGAKVELSYTEQNQIETTITKKVVSKQKTTFLLKEKGICINTIRISEEQLNQYAQNDGFANPEKMFTHIEAELKKEKGEVPVKHNTWTIHLTNLKY